MGAIGRKIKEIRMMRNYTQEYVASEAGISQGALSKIEGGRDPRASELKKMAECLEVDINVFFEKPVANHIWSMDSPWGMLLFRIRYWWYQRRRNKPDRDAS